MVVAVMSCPPEHAFLKRRAAQPSHEKLWNSRHLIGAMRELTVIAGRDREHSHVITYEAGGDVLPLEGEEKHS